MALLEFWKVKAKRFKRYGQIGVKADSMLDKRGMTHSLKLQFSDGYEQWFKVQHLNYIETKKTGG